jgi:hypothetical protein
MPTGAAPWEIPPRGCRFCPTAVQHQRLRESRSARSPARGIDAIAGGMVLQNLVAPTMLVGLARVVADVMELR